MHISAKHTKAFAKAVLSAFTQATAAQTTAEAQTATEAQPVNNEGAGIAVDNKTTTNSTGMDANMHKDKIADRFCTQRNLSSPGLSSLFFGYPHRLMT